MGKLCLGLKIIQPVLHAVRLVVQLGDGQSSKNSGLWWQKLLGMIPRLPAEVVFTPTQTRYQVDLDDYKSGMASGLADAWTVA